MVTAGTGSDLLAIVCVSSGRINTHRRRACRNTWFEYVTSSDSPLTALQRSKLRLQLLVSEDASLVAEQAEHGDMMLVAAAEGYHNLWRKVLTALSDLDSSGTRAAYFVHADDDSFVRLDLLLPLLESSPRERFYWGYIWDGTGNRATAPIRNPLNKSHMPQEQYPLDFYPPFASGCGFVLSWDLVRELVKQPLPDYRLLDPPFGIHLCGRERCILQEPIVPVHDDRVRPYRAIPIFHPSTIVQHYLQPEEMKPFYLQALEHAKQQQQQQQQGSLEGGAGAAGSQGEAAGVSVEGAGDEGVDAAAQLYSQLVAMGLLRR